jgi:hypothetical protein
MEMNHQLWSAAYYPFDMIENQHSKTIICLLFDKIVCHFPVADSACGGGHGMSGALYGDNALVNAGVIELREETLLDEIHTDFSPEFYWGTEEEFELYSKLQITAMSLNDCIQNGSVPLTDIADSPVPVSMLEKIDLKRFAQLQASALAIQSLKIALPPFKEISDEEILEARDKLKEQLVSLRIAMLTLAPSIRHGIENNVTLSNIHKEARYVVDTRINPSLQELRKKLELEKGRFWRRLILQGSNIVPTFLLNWITGNAITAALKAANSSKDFALSLIQREETIETFKNQGGIGYLLEIAANPVFKDKE